MKVKKVDDDGAGGGVGRGRRAGWMMMDRMRACIPAGLLPLHLTGLFYAMAGSHSRTHIRPMGCCMSRKPDSTRAGHQAGQGKAGRQDSGRWVGQVGQGRMQNGTREKTWSSRWCVRRRNVTSWGGWARLGWAKPASRPHAPCRGGAYESAQLMRLVSRGLTACPSPMIGLPSLPRGRWLLLASPSTRKPSEVGVPANSWQR